ncbi:hypothetical protein C5E43_23830 [Nocardia cyriacigeorgica]|nr:hypothetical protein C5B73_01540 [Nocardia cyriacigeorgica]PPJ04149.1 hypothetical protein C5E43_23830 [Nocardia cyriacigeorgica]
MLGTETGLDLEPTPSLLLTVVANGAGGVHPAAQAAAVLFAAVCVVAALCVALARKRRVRGH